MRNQLQFQSRRSAATGPKAAIVAWYVLCTGAAVWPALAGASAWTPTTGGGRQAVLLACVIIYIARAAQTLFAYVKRAIPWWEAAWGGSFIGCTLFFYLFYGLRTPQPLGPLDAAAMLVYVAGSYLGTASEHARHIWKGRPENQGHLYTGGLFKWSRHINYCGDLFLFAGLAVLTRQWWALFVPLGMALNFAFMIIPAHDSYLAARYGSEFDQYAARTRKLVPWIY